MTLPEAMRRPQVGRARSGTSPEEAVASGSPAALPTRYAARASGLTARVRCPRQWTAGDTPKSQYADPYRPDVAVLPNAAETRHVQRGLARGAPGQSGCEDFVTSR